jgi:hypothetical protein
MPTDNPILNNPYEEPRLHYATSVDGELDYERVIDGRRVFTPDIQSIPVRAGSQKELLGVIGVPFRLTTSPSPPSTTATSLASLVSPSKTGRSRCPPPHERQAC